jgi:mRNA interferase HicA
LKRSALIRHLRAHGCELLREGASHSVFVNRAAGKATVIPRRREINDFLAQDLS